MLYAATMSNPDELYFGAFEGLQRNIFKGQSDYWVVWDHGALNSPRLVVDDNGAPEGFVQCELKDGTVYGYKGES